VGLQRFLLSFSGTGTWTKCRFRHKTGTDRNQVIQYRHRKVILTTFFRPVLTGPFQSVQVLCRDRHFVLVPLPLKDRQKRCNTLRTKLLLLVFVGYDFFVKIVTDKNLRKITGKKISDFTLKMRFFLSFFNFDPLPLHFF
jgi:hypothetical protein